MSVQKRIFEIAQPTGRPVETVTLNGYRIIRACDLNGAASASPYHHCFFVRDRDGYELEIGVEIAPPCAHEVCRRSHSRVDLKSNYWIALAERQLADYLWENDDFPPDANLVVSQLTPEDCDLARRWNQQNRLARFAALLLIAAIAAIGGRAGQAQNLYGSCCMVAPCMHLSFARIPLTIRADFRS